jgi:hypothetical protein
VVLGELANFAAYSFASAMLVTPLGALSVITSAILASMILKETLKVEGKIGCTLCLVGAILIVLHTPEEKQIESVEEIIAHVFRPAFLLYSLFVIIASLYLIHVVAPKYGRRSVLVYIAICSIVGSITVMMCKGFGIALKLTFAGNNQLVYPSTYFFGIVSLLCIVVQLNYFNKALDTFSTQLVTPIYYVFFTSFTIIASFLLFQGIDSTDAHHVVTSLAGFVVIFLGVYLFCLPSSVSHGSAAAHPKYRKTSNGRDGPDLEESLSNYHLNAVEQFLRKDSLGLDQNIKASCIEDGSPK